MQLDIRKYLSRQSVDLQGEYLLDLSSYPVSAELTLSDPVKVSWHCRSRGTNALDLSLEIAFKANVQCARCLKELERSYRFDPEYTLYREDYECEEPELPFSADGKLDLDELAYSEISLGMPSVILCSSQCEGLCPVCGRPRAERCGCDENADGRPSAFHQLLS